MKIKKYRRRCGVHLSKGRGWDEYIFDWKCTGRYFINEYYVCKICKIQSDIEEERDNRILANENKQREDAYKAREEKWKIKYELMQKSKREDLWDDEVIRELLKGMKKKNLIIFPKYVIQLKRAIMKLDRAIKAIKQKRYDEISLTKEQEEQERIRLNTPLIVCGEHGGLFLKDVIKSGKNRWTGGQAYKCRECMRVLHRNHYQRRKEYVRKQQAEYRKNNPEIVKETRRKSWRKCNGKDKKHEST